jgi:hypothetical protein
MTYPQVYHKYYRKIIPDDMNVRPSADMCYVLEVSKEVNKQVTSYVIELMSVEKTTPDFTVADWMHNNLILFHKDIRSHFKTYTNPIRRERLLRYLDMDIFALTQLYKAQLIKEWQLF